MIILNILLTVGFLAGRTRATCNVADLDDVFEISQKSTDKQDILSAGMVQHESIINVKCKFSDQLSWVYCQNKTWIRYDKQCSKDMFRGRIAEGKGKRRRKRFIFSWFAGIICLFTRCSSPRRRDNTDPEINNCPDDIYVNAIPIQRYTFVRWSTPTAWDTRDGHLSVHLNGPGSGRPFFEGSTPVGYYARDRSGNMATCNFVVHVRVIRCPPLSRNIPDGYRMCHPSTDMVMGTVCHYGCYQGHELKGGPSRSECLGYGQWSIAKEPHCEKEKCTDIVPMGKLTYSCTADFYFRSICTYKCEYGYDIPPHIRRTKVCLASGNWNGNDPYCKDVQPPTFVNCPGTLMFFPRNNKNGAKVHWNPPAVTDNKDHSIEPLRVSGPSSFTFQEVNSYTVTYQAEDSTGNKAKQCTFSVIVKQLRCRKLYPVPYMNLNCTGTRRGSQCAFSCDENAQLNGTRNTFCLRKDDQAYSLWDMDRQPFCEVSGGCPDLPAPGHGAMACDVWLGGRLCHPSCANGYSVLVTNPLPGLVICSNDGIWLRGNEITNCHSRKDSRRRLAVMAAEFYFDGDCNNPEVQIEIKEKFVKTIQNSAGWKSKCQTSLCNIGNVQVKCGEMPMKRSATNMIIDVELYFESENNSLTSQEYENEASTISVIIHSLQASNVSFSSNDSNVMILVTMKSEGLSVECPQNSIPVFDDIIGCIPCLVGTFYSSESKTCIECPRGTYQSKTAQNSCIKCIPTQTTATSGASSSTDCEDACIPGTWSTTGLPPCIDCDVGFYENSYGSISCQKCSGNKITIKEGSTRSSDCYEYNIVFPHSTEESYSTFEVSHVLLTVPFIISTYVKCDLKSDGNIIQVSTASSNIIQLTTNNLTIRGKSEAIPDNIDVTKKWYHIDLHVDISSINLVLDDMEILLFNHSHSVDLTSFNVTLGGNGFTGSIAQFNILEGKPNQTNRQPYTCNSGDNYQPAVVHWNDFAYSSLINSYIHIPSQCDDVDGCLQNPCINGTCTDRLDGYLCTCSPGFTGLNCQINIDDCVAHACQNNATCLDNVDDYSCSCEYGYTGDLCEIAMVDGEWTDWDNWTECSVSCGNGTRHRKRSCSNPLPDNDGEYCNGDDIQTESCILEPCRECSELVATTNSSLSCSNTSDMIICSHTCDDGYWYDHDVKPNYRCGNETYYYWDFQTEDNPYARLPFCTEIIASKNVYVYYKAFYDLEQCNNYNESEIRDLVEARISSAFTNLTCYTERKCELQEYEVIHCGNKHRHRRSTVATNVGYIATLSCNTSLAGPEDCYFSLGNAVKEIKEMERIDTFDFPYAMNSYQILVNLSTSNSRLDCPSGTVAFIAYCVPCSIGSYYSEEECKLCPLGSYQDTSSQTYCIACPSRTTTEGTGSIAETDCCVPMLVDEERRPWYILGIGIFLVILVLLIIVMMLYGRHVRKRRYKMNAMPADNAILNRIVMMLNGWYVRQRRHEMNVMPADNAKLNRYTKTADIPTVRTTRNYANKAHTTELE